MHPSAPPAQVGFGSFTAQGYPEATMHHQQIPTMTTTTPRQPYPSPYAPAGNMQWSTALCHCFDDPQNCLITSFCPCITFGQVSEIINKGNTSCAVSGARYGLLLPFTGLSCLYSCFYRSKLRGQYDLEEAPFNDCLVHVCCELCALCQEYRELKNRGFDMGIGWQANIDRKNRGVTVAPIQRGMSR